MSNPFLSRYLSHLEQQPNRNGRNVAPATIKATRADLQGFIAWWEDQRRLAFDPTNVLDRDLRDWQEWRQDEEGARVSTINRASASLRGFFAWAQTAGLIHYNPAADLRDLPQEVAPPRGVSPEAVRWLEEVASHQKNTIARARDMALLLLLSDCGLRSQEAADIQLRDLDLRADMLTVRAGKRRKTRRIPIEGETRKRLREYLRVRCPDGLPPIGSDAEREPLLIGLHYEPLPEDQAEGEELEADEERPKWKKVWTPGMQTVTMRKRLSELADIAIEQIRQQIGREPNLTRIGELEAVIRDLSSLSPHKLRHGLAYRLRKNGYDLGYVKRILGHSRAATSMRYGEPNDDDLRSALRESNKATKRSA